MLLPHCTLQSGFSPLHGAAGGNADIVKILLEAGVPLDIKDNVGIMPC